MPPSPRSATALGVRCTDSVRGAGRSVRLHADFRQLATTQRQGHCRAAAPGIRRIPRGVDSPALRAHYCRRGDAHERTTSHVIESIGPCGTRGGRCAWSPTSPMTRAIQGRIRSSRWSRSPEMCVCRGNRVLSAGSGLATPLRRAGLRPDPVEQTSPRVRRRCPRRRLPWSTAPCPACGAAAHRRCRPASAPRRY
jgi:hypothetical protein